MSQIDPAAFQAAVAAALPDALRAVLPDALRAAMPDADEPTGPRPLLTKRELATLLAVSLTSIDTLLARGEIVPVRIGGSVRFTPEAVDDFLRRHVGTSRRRRSGRVAA